MHHKFHLIERLQDRLIKLYPGTAPTLLKERLSAFLDRFEVDQRQPDEVELWDEKDIYMITYADMVRSTDKTPLEVLHKFSKDELEDLISTIHLLPFFPYSSDDGFSVVNYREVQAESGSWNDIDALGRDFKLMFDFVLNHASAKSSWFKDFLTGVAPGRDFFISLPADTDVSEVTRPRSSPLLTKVNTNTGKRHVWTTFSPDQVDLDFSNPDVLFEFLDIMLFYVRRGASVLRMDAIAYLWKELGTNCIHLPKTHEVVKLFRDLLDLVAPETIILTETNVPHKENISYFGDNDEAHMVYQFSLPPLLLHGLLNEDASTLRDWAAGLTDTTSHQTFLNFTSSHDGIGVRPLQGLVPDKEIQALADHVQQNAGKVSMKANSDGTESPYELNITYYDALKKDGDDAQKTVDRFILSQAVALSLKGVPAVYFNNLLGSTNNLSGFMSTGRARTLNRQKWNIHSLHDQINDEKQHYGRVFEFYKEMLKVRRTQVAFHPNTDQTVFSDLPDEVFGFGRNENALICLFNFSEESVEVDALEMPIDLKDYDLLFSNNIELADSIDPLSFYWLKSRNL